MTGPTSGLGRAATSIALAALGARVVLVGRSEQRLAPRAGRAGRGPTARTGSRSSSRTWGRSRPCARPRAQVLDTESRLDVLVDNAGAIFPERALGPDGIERTFATLVVGPFVLTAGLLPLLRGNAGRPGHLGDFGGHVHTAAGRPRPSIRSGCVQRITGLRESQAGTGGPDARMGTSDGAGAARA